METPIVTVNDLKARWQDFPLGAEPAAEIHLADALAIINAQLPAAHNVSHQLIELVACQMVKRFMAVSALPEGVTSVSQTVGPFATQMGFSPNNQALFLTKAEKKLLGIGAQRASSIDLLEETIGAKDPTLHRAEPYSAIPLA